MSKSQNYGHKIYKKIIIFWSKTDTDEWSFHVKCTRRADLTSSKMSKSISSTSQFISASKHLDSNNDTLL